MVMTIEAHPTTWVKLHGHRAPQLAADALIQAVRANDEQKILELDGLLRAIDVMLVGGPDAQERGREHRTIRADPAGLGRHRRARPNSRRLLVAAVRRR